MSNDNAKRAAGYKAAELIEDGMKVGLGTGSTAFFFIERLIERVKAGLQIQAIATSKASTEQAKKGGLTLIEPHDLINLDVDVDGADEIDLQKQMIKGGGGALFREKIIASSSKEMIVIIDEKKKVEKLGKHALPIEISPYGLNSTLEKLRRIEITGHIRMLGDKFYYTDNGNLILDSNIEKFNGDLNHLDHKIIAIPGVIETGLFLGLAGRVIVGYEDGHVDVLENL